MLLMYHGSFIPIDCSNNFVNPLILVSMSFIISHFYDFGSRTAKTAVLSNRRPEVSEQPAGLATGCYIAEQCLAKHHTSEKMIGTFPHGALLCV